MNKATVLSPYAASLTLRRTGLNFIFSANRGCAATPLHPCLRADAPYRGFKFRSLALAISPSTSDFSLCANSCINLNKPGFFMIFFLVLTFSRIDVTMPLVPVSATVGASHKVAAKGWGLK